MSTKTLFAGKVNGVLVDVFLNFLNRLIFIVNPPATTGIP
jgi:hypothetical protein